MLARPVALWDIRDCESFCARALDAQLRAMHATLIPQEHEDALAYLIGFCFELSLKFEPERCTSFSKYAYNGLRRWGVTNWFRQRFGSTRSRPLPELLHLDPFVTDRYGRNRLESLERGGTGDPARDRSPDLAGALRG